MGGKILVRMAERLRLCFYFWHATFQSHHREPAVPSRLRAPQQRHHLLYTHDCHLDPALSIRCSISPRVPRESQPHRSRLQSPSRRPVLTHAAGSGLHSIGSFQCDGGVRDGAENNEHVETARQRAQAQHRDRALQQFHCGVRNTTMNNVCISFAATGGCTVDAQLGFIQNQSSHDKGASRGRVLLSLWIWGRVTNSLEPKPCKNIALYGIVFSFRIQLSSFSCNVFIWTQEKSIIH